MNFGTLQIEENIAAAEMCLSVKLGAAKPETT